MEESNKDDTYKHIIKFIDALSKTLEGLKDKYTSQIFESQKKNEKVDPILTNWVNHTNLVIKEKYEESFNQKYDEGNFKINLLKWVNTYKDNEEFILNIKVLFKHLNIIRNTIEIQVTSNDPLSYNELTDSLIKKYSNTLNNIKEVNEQVN